MEIFEPKAAPRPGSFKIKIDGPQSGNLSQIFGPMVSPKKAEHQARRGVADPPAKNQIPPIDNTFANYQPEIS